MPAASSTSIAVTPKQLRISTAEPATNSVTAFTAFPMPGIIPAVRQSAICRRESSAGAIRFRISCIPTSTPSDDFKRPFTQVSSSSVIWDKISSPERSFTRAMSR